jgi:lysophospholipase L1-like esterase
LLATFYLLSTILLTACAKREIINIDSKGTNIICFGDSITFGYGANPGEDYPSVLAKMINAPVINAGIDGDTSIEALRRIDTDVLDRDPLLVIVEFGGNDFLKRTPLAETLSNVEEMIKKVQSAGAMVAITDVGAGMIMSDYGKEFRRLGKRYRAIFIPHLLSGILANPSLKSDSIHPNAEGYKFIAQKVYRVVTPYLNHNAILRQSQK